MPTIKSDTWQRITYDMGQVVYNELGTGRNALPENTKVKIYGKTGTVENPHGEDHAWYIGWMSYEKRNYSAVVLLENSGSGGAIAAPVAKKVFDIISENKSRSQMIGFQFKQNKELPYGVIVAVSFLSILGLLVLYSISEPQIGNLLENPFSKQFYF